MTVTIDLKARRFGANETAWRLFPGSGYRHYDTMHQYNKVFLDLPYLPLISGSARKKSPELLKQISLSLDASPFVQRDDENAIQRLSEIISADRRPTVWSNKRSLALGWVNALYADAKIGDIVVIPGPGYRKNADNQYELSPTLIGEIISGTSTWLERGPEQYLRGKYLTRDVRWLEEATEADLSARAQMSLRTQNALVKINAEELNNILGAAFKNVITDHEVLARFITKNDDPSSYEVHQFQAFIQATTAAMKASREDVPLDGTSLFEIAGALGRDARFVLAQDANFHSPGYSTLIATFGEATHAAKNLPLVISCIFALACDSTAEPFDIMGNLHVDLINTESTTIDPCSPDIGLEKDVRDTLKVIGYNRWQKWCDVAQAASTNDGFASVANVKN